MIDRQHGRIVIECDSCDEVFEGASDDWQEVWPAERREGWKTNLLAKEWLHGCAACGKPT